MICSMGAKKNCVTMHIWLYAAGVRSNPLGRPRITISDSLLAVPQRHCQRQCALALFGTRAIHRRLIVVTISSESIVHQSLPQVNEVIDKQRPAQHGLSYTLKVQCRYGPFVFMMMLLASGLKSGTKFTTESTTVNHHGPSIRQNCVQFLIHASPALPDYAHPWCLISCHPAIRNLTRHITPLKNAVYARA